MSVERVKSIILKPKEGKIFITSACSNCTPKTYNKWEFMQEETDYHKKELKLMRGINGGGLSLNDSCYKWNYARLKANEELYNNGGSWQIYEDSEISCKTYCLGELISSTYISITENDVKSGKYMENYKGKNYTLYYDIEEYNTAKTKAHNTLENYYKVFMKYFNEKHDGQYYLYSEKYGNIEPKGTTGSFYYNVGDGTIKPMDYMKAYCLTYYLGRDVEIKEIPTRQYKPTQEQIEESKNRIAMLGLSEKCNNKLYMGDMYNYVVSDFDIIKAINEFEIQHNAYVYYVIYTSTTFGRLYAMLYVSNEKQEWQEDRNLLSNGQCVAYVYNKTTPIFSEIGLIGFEKSSYNKDVLNRTF